MAYPSGARAEWTQTVSRDRNHQLPSPSELFESFSRGSPESIFIVVLSEKEVSMDTWSSTVKSVRPICEKHCPFLLHYSL